MSEVVTTPQRAARSVAFRFASAVADPTFFIRLEDADADLGRPGSGIKPYDFNAGTDDSVETMYQGTLTGLDMMRAAMINHPDEPKDKLVELVVAATCQLWQSDWRLRPIITVAAHDGYDGIHGTLLSEDQFAALEPYSTHEGEQ